MYNHSYENKFNLEVNKISFPYGRMDTKTRFEKEAKGNSEMVNLRRIEAVTNLVRSSTFPSCIHGTLCTQCRPMILCGIISVVRAHFFT